MKSLFAQDLKVARRRSGLSQKDLAILLEASEKEISSVESGKRLPTLSQITKLTLIFNRVFPSLYEMLREAARHELFRQLPSLPEQGKKGAVDAFNRDNTLKALENRLADALSNPANGSA
ncbi:MAG: helix-turn-helix transcriptional regulator [Pseudomonadota bacterium]